MAHAILAPIATHKFIYRFGGTTAEGDASMKALLGGKGANLAEMCKLGLPVPPGFTLSTETCSYFYAHGQSYPKSLEAELAQALAALEQQTARRFGVAENPLLVSVRSGARASMPGMMDTILNLGLNDATAAGLATQTGDARFAYDSYRRFIQMYGQVVLGVPHHVFEDILEQHKRDEKLTLDTELTAAHWQAIIADYLQAIKKHTGNPFPQDVHEQLWGAIGAVFKSWQNPRANTYRKLNNIPADWGTAVTVQAMVFGNRGANCATGVAFTRNPANGENIFYGEYLPNAQGEDVVAGLRTPLPLLARDGAEALENTMPAVFAQLVTLRAHLERTFADMQDIEFTVESGKLYVLQTRNGKRTAAAAIQIAVDMVAEGLIDKKEALLRLEPESLNQLLHPTLDPHAERRCFARGLPASPGAAAGRIVFSAEAAEDLAAKGEPVILCRAETSPEDIHGMHAAKGILTTRGGMTSHAAVVARGMGRTCIVGAGHIRIDEQTQTMSAGSLVLKAGDWLTLDGGTGEVLLGKLPTREPELSGAFTQIMGWADEVRQLRVRANAETPQDAAMARRFGAEGIGLARTEHMFFEASRITHMRAMILAENSAAREQALAALEPEQQQDFLALFRIMAGLPVNIRLLDPPLHEFLPKTAAEAADAAQLLGLSAAQILSRAADLEESNPMLGHRGCRLGITFPEIYAMQARAIFAAAQQAQNEGLEVLPEIMLPLIANKAELITLKTLIDDVAKNTAPAVRYSVGTMIELPRAALRAGELAEHAAFFSFGTNDLTQTTWGLSRDDAGHFLPHYQQGKIIAADPFSTLDIDGVGELMSLACERGRKTRADIKLGICGEHGGDPASIAFCQSLGLNYVSCSPYRVPIARLAAAQASLRQKQSV